MFSKNKIILSNNKIDYMILFFINLILIFVVFRLWKIDITKYPIQWRGDAITAYSGAKMLLEDGLFGSGSRYGIPFPNKSIDFYSGGMINRIARWIIVSITRNPIFAVNISYFMGYVFASFSSYYVLRRVGISRSTSIVVATLYAFTPFHLIRGICHLGYSQYWLLPLGILYAIQLCTDNPEDICGNDSKRKVNNVVLKYLVFILLGGLNVYYVGFTLFFFFIAFLFNIVNRRIEKAWQSIKSCIIICLACFIYAVPYIISNIQNGSNKVIAIRSQEEIQIYSLKIGHLLLPNYLHRIGALRLLTQKYNEYSFSNENVSAALGVFFALGFIYLFIFIFRRTKQDEVLHVCSIFNMASVLLALTGGLASIIGMFFAMIRCYNRISIYIAFLSAISFGKLVDKLVFMINKKNVIVFILASALCVGIYDQTFEPTDGFDLYSGCPKGDAYYDEIVNKWNEDEEYFKCIEESVTPETLVYQMPYMKYPEAGKVGNITDYEAFYGYIHTNTLKWSYGCYKGREGDNWNEQLANKSMEDIITEIINKGFRGLLVDSYGYEKESFDNLTRQLEKYIGDDPLIDHNGRLYFYSLSGLE